MLANKSRTWVAGTMVLCLLLAVASWFLLIGPKRAQAADLEAQTVSVESQNQQIEARIEQLKVQFAELPQRQAELAAIRQAMPEDAALPTLVRDLDAIAEASGVTLMTLSPGTPVAVQTAPPAAPAAEGTDAETPADGAAAAATPAAPTDLLVSVPTSLVVVGGFFEADLFLKKLQSEMPRAFLVTNLTVAAETASTEAAGGRPATENGDVTMTIAGSVFVLQSAPAATAPANPAGTATTPADPAAAPPADAVAN